ncbi:MAG: Dabb family protein [Bacteroidetes bacterium]|nr:Dabb family protein [Bacteroidota bacterium]
MITHSVFFKLKYPAASPKTGNFFAAAKELSSIPGVQNFKEVRQTGKKNNYDYGLIMEFNSQELYDQYNNHPLHTQFIEQYWIPGVTEFMEIDYE